MPDTNVNQVECTSLTRCSLTWSCPELEMTGIPNLGCPMLVKHRRQEGRFLVGITDMESVQRDGCHQVGSTDV